jgi:hypothetical protein
MTSAPDTLTGSRGLWHMLITSGAEMGSCGLMNLRWGDRPAVWEGLAWE